MKNQMLQNQGVNKEDAAGTRMLAVKATHGVFIQVIIDVKNNASFTS